MREDKQKAISLRIQGKSYGEIMKVLNTPSKGTLSSWFRNLELPYEARKRLENNILLAQKRGLMKFNEERTKRIQIENEKIHRIAENKIGKISHRELLLVGTALYWGGGTKTYLAFSNSNPLIIKMFIRFIREVLAVTDEKIRPQIHIHPNLDKFKAIKFWARITKLPKSTFICIDQISRASQGKRPKNSLPFGTLDIRINKRQVYQEMMGLIKGLSLEGGY